MPDTDPVDEVTDSLDEASGLLRGVGEDFWAGQSAAGARIAAAVMMLLPPPIAGGHLYS